MKHVLAFIALIAAIVSSTYGTIAIVRCVHAIERYQQQIRDK